MHWSRLLFMAILLITTAGAVNAQAAPPTNNTNGGVIVKFELPPLPYDYNALEPYISEEIMRLHHDKHHAAYVKGLNTAEEKLADSRQAAEYDIVSYWERQYAFNGSGHILHTMFWENMGPNGEREPKGDLLRQIEKDFGSYDNFKKQFSAVAEKVEASGWAVLGWQPQFEKLVILQVLNHQNVITIGVQPLLVLDMWEHAYYLQYQNRRPDWIAAWWNVVNFEDVSKRFADVAKTVFQQEAKAHM